MEKVKIGEGYWLNDEGIASIEEQYSGTFMGCWAVKQDNGVWSEVPVDVFYVENPDVEAGHSNYFGVFFKEEVAYLCNAETCFSEPLQGIVIEDEVVISRYRHDFSGTKECAIDGGRDYTKVVGTPERRCVVIDGADFVVTGANL